MPICKQAVDLVRNAECVGGVPDLKSYRCSAGVLTIGFGHTGPDVKEGMTCSPAQAYLWLAADLDKAARAVDKLVTVPLSDNARGALASFVFNLGPNALKGSTLLRKLNAGAPPADVAAEFKKWVKATVDGRIVTLNGLVTRRAAESALFLS